MRGTSGFFFPFSLLSFRSGSGIIIAAHEKRREEENQQGERERGGVEVDRGIAAASGLCRSEEVRALVLVPSTSSDSVLPWCLFWLGLSNYFCAFFGGAFLVGITRGLLLEAEGGVYERFPVEV